MAKAKISDYLSPVNRQDVPYELPVAAYMRAQVRIEHAKQAHREQRKRNGLFPFRKVDEQQMRDYEVSQVYRHHVTDMRGTQTQKRSNAVVKE